MLIKTFQDRLALQYYLIAAIIFGFYGGLICPMLDTLPLSVIMLHSVSVFLLTFTIRQTLIFQRRGSVNLTKLDSGLLFAVSLPFALFYNLLYDFTLDSNLKVIFGLTLFGFFSGALLELSKQLTALSNEENTSRLSANNVTKSASFKHQILFVMLLLTVLTVSLSSVAIKDIFWLEHNPEFVQDGSGKISVIKELIFVSVILGGYALAIVHSSGKLTSRKLEIQQQALERVAGGQIHSRVPVIGNDELSVIATYANSMLDKLEEGQNELKLTRDVAITSLSSLAESRDNETGAHIIRTQNYVKALAEYLSHSPSWASTLTPDYIDLLHKSAPLHDVGKVGIPDSILLKPGKLTDEEFDIMKNHPQIGADALSAAEQQLGSNSFLVVAKEIALTHHEKWDGSGYPNRLVGEEIPLSGRLMAVADVYDALISKRVYKPAFSHQKAREIIVEGAGTHFDPLVVDAFIAIETQFEHIAATHTDSQGLKAI